MDWTANYQVYNPLKESKAEPILPLHFCPKDHELIGCAKVLSNLALDSLEISDGGDADLEDDEDPDDLDDCPDLQSMSDSEDDKYHEDLDNCPDLQSVSDSEDGEDLDDYPDWTPNPEEGKSAAGSYLDRS